MGTSIGKAIDWLVAQLPSPAAAVDPVAVVADGWPTVASRSTILIGRNDDGHAAEGEQSVLTLGTGMDDEEYMIPCQVEAYRPGKDLKPARDAAIALFDVVAHLVAADRTLGGVLLAGRYAVIEKIAIIQDHNNDSVPNAEHMCVIQFDVHCTNHYQP